MKFDLTCNFAKRNLRAIAPGREKLLLHWQDAIKASEQELRPARGVLPKRFNQFKRQTPGSDHVACATFFIEVSEPIAECGGIPVPGALRFLVQETRCIGANE